MGFVDGPSAGGIYTAAALAVLLGDQFLPTVAMTGGINPDFTIGPVGGIPQKLEAAQALGVTTVLIPTGQRFNQDSASGELVDVVEKGRQLGLEVIEVGDIYEAYELLTGKTLPGPAASSAEPELSPTAHDLLFDQAVDFLQAAQGLIDEYATLPADYKSDYEEGRIVRAQEAIDGANKQLAQGLAGAGCSASLEAAFNALLAVNYVDIEEIVQTQGEPAAVEALLAGTLHQALQETQERLLAFEPPNVSAVIALLQAWGDWTAASGLVDQGDRELQNAPAGEEANEDRLTAIYNAVYGFTRADLALWSAENAVALGEQLQGEPLSSTEDLEQLAEGYRLAANANLETIRTLVVSRLAQQEGITEAQASAMLAQDDDNYAEAWAVAAYYSFLKEVLPEGPARDYAVLGAALTGFADSATSLADHYSYQAERDEDGIITGFTHDKALASGLDFARARARTMIAMATEGGNDTGMTTLYYQNGSVAREGNPADKLDALYDYWIASLYSQVMGVLSGTLKPLAPRP